MKRSGAGIAGLGAKRRLLWPGAPGAASPCGGVCEAPEQDVGDCGGDSGDLGASPCLSPPPRAHPGQARPPSELLLRSPTHDGAVMLLAGAGAPAAGAREAPPAQRGVARSLASALLADSGSRVGPPPPAWAAGGAEERAPPASSSSRRSWAVMFAAAGSGLCEPDPQPQPQPPPRPPAATPALASAGGQVPGAPRKCSVLPPPAEGGAAPPRGGCAGPARAAARALPGLAPASAAELQAARAWLTALEAR
ncbi:hypothetical protein HT031_005278 [Scenedesmus sp. PABB004]|nr:hypothetical protein HT031_005278 [Scenedesmus sp. PABB004]